MFQGSAPSIRRHGLSGENGESRDEHHLPEMGPSLQSHSAATPGRDTNSEAHSMPTDSFPNIDVDVSSQRVTFAEAGLGPKWILDVSLFAGQPALNASRTDLQHPNQEIITLTITLTNARYPGTNLIADLTVELREINNFLSGQIVTTVKATLAFANITFLWTSDEFVDWLNGVTQQSAQISPSGQVVALGTGGITFGPATAATLIFTPALMTIAASQVCSFDVFGVVSTATSLSVALAATAAQTTVTVQASAPFAASVPAATPIGSLTAAVGFDTLSAATTEASRVATFSSSQANTSYTLELLGGVSDLNGGPVQFDLAGVRLEIDFTSTPQTFILIGPGRASTSLLIAAGIGLSIPQPSDGSGTLGINLFFDGQQWNVQEAALPLPGLFLPLDDGIAEPGSPLGTDFSLFPSGPNWIALGDLAAGAPRLHIEDFRLHITRPQDLLNFEIQCLNMTMEVVEGAVPTLAPNTTGPAIWRVIFPPQHAIEQAFYQGDQQPNLTNGRSDDPLATPAGVRLAGPTQLAFLVPPGLAAFSVTLANLLDWKQFELAGTSLDNPGQPPPLQSPDLDHQTAIEIPYRLFLSLDNASGWSHSVSSAADLSEIWNTRLAFRKPLDSGGFVIDERPSSGTRQGRAFWTPDLVSPVDPFGDKNGSLNSDERQQIVHLTCDAVGAHTFDVKQLMLSNLGATTDIDTNWNPQQIFNLTLWQNIISFGRDQFVRVGLRGCCLPWGHRATRITVSERRFIAQPDGSQAVAYLVQFDYVIITQPVRFYSGLDWPFKQIEFITRVTPTLSKPANLTDVDGTQVNAFWIEVDNNRPFLFDFAGVDLKGRVVRFQAPAIFVDDGNFDQNVKVAASHFLSDTTINTPIAFARQKIAFAPSDDPEDTSFEADSVSLGFFDLRPGGAGSWKDTAGDVLFRPSIAAASIHHAASAALAGTSDTLIPVKYFPQYVQQSGLHAAAAADGVDIFLQIAQAPAFQLTAAQTGVASPAYALTAISKKLGAVGGDPTQILQQGTINPGIFPDAAKFLGDISLNKILPDVIPNIPNLNTVVNSTNGIPASAVTTFEWHAPLKTDALLFGPLQLTFTDPNWT
jgi:hypothetical protein